MGTRTGTVLERLDVAAGTWGMTHPPAVRASWKSSARRGPADYRTMQASVRAYGRLADLYPLFRYLFAPTMRMRWPTLMNGSRATGSIQGSRSSSVAPPASAAIQQGRLHSATGKCLEYRDGWGFYAWHGVPVPEKAILTPEQLTREDFLQRAQLGGVPRHPGAHGERFVPELGGR